MLLKTSPYDDKKYIFYLLYLKFTLFTSGTSGTTTHLFVVNFKTANVGFILLALFPNTTKELAERS
jgi:hypothetical protein